MNDELKKAVGLTYPLPSLLPVTSSSEAARVLGNMLGLNGPLTESIRAMEAASRARTEPAAWPSPRRKVHVHVHVHSGDDGATGE